MSEPLVSICIRNFNLEKFVSYAIESVLAQTYQNIEVIVLNCGSTDRSRAVITRFGDQVRAVFQENGAMAPAINVLTCLAPARSFSLERGVGDVVGAGWRTSRSR